jgi:glycosyltransferase involved in cell wall biosynthesis
LLRLADPLTASGAGETALGGVDVLREVIGEEACDRLGIVTLPKGFLLSVIIPVYNEVGTIAEVIRRVRSLAIPMELIVVDDGSTDGTRQVLEELGHASDVKLLFQETNRGKGAALKLGFAHAEGSFVAVQDGDLEYDPRDLLLLLPPLLTGRADVAYGSRFGYAAGIVSTFIHQRGNQLITALFNLRHRLSLTDVETCHKVFRRELIEAILPTLQENRFGIELEITAKLARTPGVRFCERPISYAGRSYLEGKKIGCRDAIRAVWCILRY